jgi:hypothetical protein
MTEGIHKTSPAEPLWKKANCSHVPFRKQYRRGIRKWFELTSFAVTVLHLGWILSNCLLNIFSPRLYTAAIFLGASTWLYETTLSRCCGTAQLKRNGTRWRTAVEVAYGVGSHYPSLPRNMVYPALLPLMRTPRLPVVDWTDAPADLNGLVRFAERQNLVSARVPSHFKRSLSLMDSRLCRFLAHAGHRSSSAEVRTQLITLLRAGTFFTQTADNRRWISDGLTPCFHENRVVFLCHDHPLLFCNPFFHHASSTTLGNDAAVFLRHARLGPFIGGMLY